MKTGLIFYMLLCLLGLNSVCLYAQATPPKQSTTDSLHNIQLSAQLSRLQQLQAQHVADSLKKVSLEQQLNTLKNNDKQGKISLERELNALKGQDSLRAARQKQQVDSLRKVVKGFPVVFFKDTLFTIYNRQGSFSPKERAAAVVTRLDAISSNHYFEPDSLKIVAAEQTIDLQYGNYLVVSISETDALWANKTKGELARFYRAAIVKTVSYYKQETSWQTLLKEAALALLVIFTAGLIIYLLQKVFNWSRIKIMAQKGKLIKGLRIKNYELFTADRSVSVLLTIDALLKWFLILLVVYLALPLLFGIFPWTKDYSEKLLGYFITPVNKILVAIWNYIPNFITIIVLVVIFKYIIRFLRFLKDEIERGILRIPGFYTDWANPTFQIVRILVLAFMLIVIFPYMPGSDSPVFKGVSVFVGVLFTFGSAGALGNVVAGLVLTYMRAFKIGDRVKIGDATGDIIEKSLLVTRIRTIKNEIISIPNAMVMNNHTVNFSIETAHHGLIIHKTVTVGYDVPWRQVHQLLIEAANAVTLIEQDPQPFVLQTGLDDFYAAYQINGYTKQAGKQALIYSQLYQNIQDKFNEAGIELMSPHFQAHRDGSVINIPPGYVPRQHH